MKNGASLEAPVVPTVSSWAWRPPDKPTAATNAPTAMIHLEVRCVIGIVCRSCEIAGPGAWPRPGALAIPIAASAACQIHSERRSDLGLLDGRAVAAGDGRAGDGVFLQRRADGERAGVALDRPARRQDIGDPDDIRLGHMAQDHALGMRIDDVVKMDLLAIVFERKIVLHLLNFRHPPPLCEF